MMNFLKRIGRSAVCRILEKQATRLRSQHDFTIITVNGSVGKTSTKHAIAHVLQAAGKRVRYQEGSGSFLADPADGKRLVRQSHYWQEVKARQFARLSLRDSDTTQ